MPADRGFTLIEVLIAFVIAALALGALFHGAAGSLASTGAAGRYGEALSRARSHLATIGHGVPLAATRQGGDEAAGYHWDLAITQLASAATLALYAVEVDETWHDATGPRRIRLVTRRIGPP